MKNKGLFLPFCLIILFSACQSKQNSAKVASIGFYYWQTAWQWTAVEQQYMDSLQAKALYIRFFDLDWNEHEKRVVPVSPLRQSTEKQTLTLPAQVAITPTIFITNRAMFNLPDAEVEEMANKIHKKIAQQLQEIFPTHAPLTALQVDCDWSEGTREKFFRLCKLLKRKNIELSATIRLHQIKYLQKTGVPPIDKGVLMCYNVGKIDGSNTDNSILDINIVRAYTPALAHYPLKLDIALPAFGWGVLKREGRVIKLINDISSQNLASTKYEKIKQNTWRVKEAHYLSGVYLYEGDEIRLEITNKTLLKQAIEAIVPYLKNKQFTLLFYHIHHKLPQYFDIKDLKSIAKK